MRKIVLMSSFCTSASDSKFLTQLYYAADLSPCVAQKQSHHKRFSVFAVLMSSFCTSTSDGEMLTYLLYVNPATQAFPPRGSAQPKRVCPLHSLRSVGSAFATQYRTKIDLSFTIFRFCCSDELFLHRTSVGESSHTLRHSMSFNVIRWHSMSLSFSRVIGNTVLRKWAPLGAHFLNTLIRHSRCQSLAVRCFRHNPSRLQCRRYQILVSNIVSQLQCLWVISMKKQELHRCSRCNRSLQPLPPRQLCQRHQYT